MSKENNMPITPQQRAAALEALDMAVNSDADFFFKAGQYTAFFKHHGDTIRALLAEPGPQWEPIETAPKDGTIILRPHVIWGAKAVRHKRPDQTEEYLRGYSWMSSDYSQLWPEDAFHPFWQPLPEAPHGIIVKEKKA
jgi:hypothetical protein